MLADRSLAWPRALLVVGIVLILAIGVGVGIVIRPQVAPVQTDISDESKIPEAVPVGEELTNMSASAALNLSVDPAVAYSIGPVSGRVTWLPDPPPAPRNGTVLVEVDGRRRPAYLEDKPLWRPVESTGVGADADGVRRFLVSIGLASTIDPTPAEFDEAVRQFERDHGWEESGVFRPKYVVWVPAMGARPIRSYSVSVGEIVVEESTLATSSPRVADGQVTERSGAAIDLQPVERRWVFESSEGVVVPISDSGEVVAIDNGQAHELAEIAETNDPVLGQVRLDGQVLLHTVPGSAILVTDSGATCVVSTSGRSTPVTVVGSTLGTVRFTSSLPVPSQVVMDPNHGAADGCG